MFVTPLWTSFAIPIFQVRNKFRNDYRQENSRYLDLSFILPSWKTLSPNQQLAIAS